MSDLMRPSSMLSTVQSFLKPRTHNLKDVAIFSDCTGSHEKIFDIDLDDSYTIPAILKKSNDMSQMFLEGVMTQDVHVDKLRFDVIWNGNLFHTEEHAQDADVSE